MTDKKLILPDIIIAGAPKCGTTSLFRYLSDNPLICPSKIKETRFLIDPGYPLFNKKKNFHKDGIVEYSSFFSIHAGMKKLYMEATPDYLYQKTPLSVLKTFPHKPYIIISLRKPSERIFSLFKFAQNNMGVINPEITFSQYIGMVRKKELSQKRIILRNSLRHSKYNIYIEKWFQNLGKEKIKIILFENLVTQPYNTIKEIAGFIGINPDYYKKYPFSIENKSLEIKNHTLNRVIKRLRPIVPGIFIKSIMANLYKGINTKNSLKYRSLEDIETMDQLNDYFKPYNSKLAKITGIKLDIWD